MGIGNTTGAALEAPQHLIAVVANGYMSLVAALATIQMRPVIRNVPSSAVPSTCRMQLNGAGVSTITQGPISWRVRYLNAPGFRPPGDP